MSQQSLTLVNVPLAATVTSAQILVVEVDSPDGSTNGNAFYIGSNSLPQSGPSYIYAPACGLTDITDLATIGFPNMHIIMRVNGGCGAGTATATVQGTVPATVTQAHASPPQYCYFYQDLYTFPHLYYHTDQHIYLDPNQYTYQHCWRRRSHRDTYRYAVPVVEPTHLQPQLTSTVCPIQFTDVPNGSTFYVWIRCLALPPHRQWLL